MQKHVRVSIRLAGWLAATALVTTGLVLAVPASVTADADPLTLVEPFTAIPEVVAGYAATVLGPLAAGTAIAFGPGDDDGPDLYATSLLGRVDRYHLTWTPTGPVVVDLTTRATGFSQPLGLVFDDDGVLYVADSGPNTLTGRTDGRITALAPDDTARTDGITVVGGLPNGRHNTNHLRFGPDDRLYIANGNPNDSGCVRQANGGLNCVGGDADVFPLSGAILSVDTTEVLASPAVLRWTDDQGARIGAYQVSTHAVNNDFNAKVSVYASGFRNVFGIAFAPADLPFAGIGYTAANGADVPSSQEPLFRIAQPGTNFTFPFCFHTGPAGGVGDQLSVTNNPMFPAMDCASAPPATALLGWHTCTTGLDFPTHGVWGFRGDARSSVYVAECGPFFPDDTVDQAPESGGGLHHSVGHKVVRVALDADGEATLVQDFVSGLSLPTDVLFGPDGAMYIADVEKLVRVAALPVPDGDGLSEV